MSELSDEEIVEKAREGDASASEALFERYFPLLRARVRNRLPARLRRKVAESDIIQEAYLGALKRLSDFEDRGEGSFGGWLATIVDRRIADQVRRYMGADKRNVNREISVGDTPTDTPPARLHASDQSSVSSNPRRVEAMQSVLGAVERLAPADRMILKLVHFEGQTVAEAAELMEVSLDAARMRYGRALVRLQKQMREDASSGEASP